MKRTFTLFLSFLSLIVLGISLNAFLPTESNMQPATWELGGSQNGANVYCKLDACNGDNDFMFFKVENTTGASQTVIFHCNVSEPGKVSSVYNNVTVFVDANSSTEGTCIDLANGELKISKILQDQYMSPTVSITF